MANAVVFSKKVQDSEENFVCRVSFYASDFAIDAINNGQKTNVVANFEIMKKTSNGYDYRDDPHNKIIENINITFPDGKDSVNKLLDLLYKKYRIF